MKYRLDYIIYLPDTNTYEDIVFKLNCKSENTVHTPRDSPSAPPITANYNLCIPILIAPCIKFTKTDGDEHGDGLEGPLTICVGIW